MRIVVALGAAALLAGCVPPEPMPAAYTPLQPYRLLPDYQPPPVREAPLAQPLPPYATQPPAPNPAPPPTDDTGALPLDALPAPAPDSASTTPTAPAASDATPPVEKKSSTATGPGSNVPLEGFRPLHGVSRPTP